MSRTKSFILAAAALSATLTLGLAPARALDLDDLDDLPIRRIIKLPVPGPVIVIPIDLDD